MREIEHEYVYIDTSIYKSENFLAGKKLQTLFEYNSKKKIILLTTSITRKEALCLADINYNEGIKQIKNSISKNLNTYKILKNLSVDAYINSTFDDFEEKYKELRAKLVCQFNEQLEIEIEDSILGEVINDYFEMNPPFGEGKKKNEFPDAFVLKSLEKFAKQENISIYVISYDGDFIKYKSEKLIIESNLEDFIQRVVYTFSDKNVFNKACKEVDRNKNHIVETVIEKFHESIECIDFDIQTGHDLSVTNIEITNDSLDEFKVIKTSGNLLTIEIKVSFDYKLSIDYENYDSATYDREDDIWFGIENESKEIRNTAVVTGIGELLIKMPGDDKWNEDWELLEIKSGIPEDISINDKGSY